MTRPIWLWPAIILLSAAGASVLTLGDTSSPLRTVVTLWFLLVCPGMAFVRLLQLKDPFIAWTLVIALSIALSTLLGIGMLLIDAWSPQAGVLVLAAISATGAVLQLTRQTISIEPEEVVSSGASAILAEGKSQ